MNIDPPPPPWYLFQKQVYSYEDIKIIAWQPSFLRTTPADFQNAGSANVQPHSILYFNKI